MAAAILASMTAWGQVEPPPDQSPEVLAIPVTLSGRVLDQSGLPETGPLLVVLDQQQPGGRLLHREFLPSLDTRGDFTHPIASIPLMPGVPIQVLIAPIDSARSGYSPQLARPSAHAARRFQTPSAFLSSGTPGHYKITLGEAQLLDAPKIASAIVRGFPGEQVQVFARPSGQGIRGPVLGALGAPAGSILSPSLVVPTGSAFELYSFEPASQWELTGTSGAGRVILPAAFLRGSTPLIQVDLVALIELHVNVSAVHAEARYIAVFDATAYSPPNCSWPGNKSLFVDERIMTHRGTSARPGETASLYDLPPGQYVLELWQAGDYQTAQPSAVAFISLTDSAAIEL